MAFKRDPNTKAIVNTDDSYFRNILNIREQQKELEATKAAFKELVDELSEIKKYLKENKWQN